jgi:uncharacterized protein (TIGR02646 family)
MRPVNKELFTTNQEIYNPYGDAKDDLISALGSYCSYCERYGHYTALDVEHINNKNHYPEQEFNWSNFLLACKNCNSIKGNKEINLSLMPHIDNTFIIFKYLESGLIIINQELIDTLEITTNTQQLLDLIGLDRVPGHPRLSNKDKRWQERKKVWEIAVRYLDKYQSQECDIETIRDLALANGFWSIWMTIFEDYDDIKQELISAFPGTREEYFINEF